MLIEIMFCGYSSCLMSEQGTHLGAHHASLFAQDRKGPSHGMEGERKLFASETEEGLSYASLLQIVSQANCHLAIAIMLAFRIRKDGIIIGRFARLCNRLNISAILLLTTSSSNNNMIYML